MPEKLTLLHAVILLSQEETSVSRVQLRQQVLLNGGTSQKNFVSGSNMQIFLLSLLGFYCVLEFLKRDNKTSLHIQLVE